MNKILILFAHPALSRSRVNRTLIRGIDTIDGVTFRDLYEIYPEFGIDVDAEQELLNTHDTIIFQHPFYWYSIPSILKEWQDLVLEHGWAYGSDGNALAGKRFFCVVTTGGAGEAYKIGGYNRFTIRQLLSPIEQTAYLCKMKYLPPFAIHGSHAISKDEVETARHQYYRLLEDLRDDTIDLDAAAKLDYLNSAPRLTQELSR